MEMRVIMIILAKTQVLMKIINQKARKRKKRKRKKIV